MKPDISVKLCSIKLQNPIILASGTCGFGEEIAKFLNLNKVGALITKTITLKPKEGNPPPRIAEVEGGIINSIGLENPGIKVFVKDKLPFLKKDKISIDNRFKVGRKYKPLANKPETPILNLLNFR